MIGVIVVGGAPATGKSTVMNAFIKYIGEKPDRFEFSQVKGHLYHRNKVALLGIYHDGDIFPGTDRLSMSVQRSFDHMIDEWSREQAMNGWVVIFEGDRLFNSVSLRKCLNLPHAYYVLTCNEAVMAYRRAARLQNESWVKGRVTKVEGLRGQFNMRELPNNVAQDALSNAMILIEDVRRLREEAEKWKA